MFERLKANRMFVQLLKRPDIDKAYAMVPPTDSWYDTITTVHDSLAEVKKLPHEDWTVTSHDGLGLKALYYPGTSDKTMVWVHGYTSHAERESAFPALFYRSLGFNILIPYLRAHGPSGGKFISFGALEARDVALWVDRVNERHPAGSIFIHGLSMGGGTVLNLSGKVMENVKGLVVDAPNVSIADFFRNVTVGFYKKHPNQERICRYAMERFRKEFGVDAADFESLQIVKNCKYPMLLSAGSNEQMEEILDAIAQNNPMKTTVLILPGCNHGNGMYKQTELYQKAITEFISASL